MTQLSPGLKTIARTVALLVLVSLGHTVVGPPQLPDPGSASIGRDQQVQLGFKAASQVYEQMPVLPDSSAETQYIRKLGKKLVATIPSQYSWPFEFHVIPQKEINAFALPGGPMFLNRGMLQAARTDDEVAGVIVAVA